MYSDLPAIETDRKIFEKLANQHEFDPDEIKIFMDPKMKECFFMINSLDRLFRSKPHETVLAFSCFASHGMIQSGRQVILLNEFLSGKGFYKIFGVEENMRILAMKYSNAYIVVIYACCREIFMVAQHCGGISLNQVKEIELAKKVRAQ